MRIRSQKLDQADYNSQSVEALALFFQNFFFNTEPLLVFDPLTQAYGCVFFWCGDSRSLLLPLSLLIFLRDSRDYLYHFIISTRFSIRGGRFRLSASTEFLQSLNNSLWRGHAAVWIGSLPFATYPGPSHSFQMRPTLYGKSRQSERL